MKKKPLRKLGLIRRFFSALGPSVTTGAADDDPSGIATYSQGQPSSWLSRIVVGATALVMFGAAAAMFLL